jgi:hypothetical protein
MATMVVGAGAMVGVVMAMVVGSRVAADLHVVQPVDFTVAAGFVAALWPTAVEGSTVAEGSTAAVVDMAAADTGNHGGSGVS